jgi:hypothetical protein
MAIPIDEPLVVRFHSSHLVIDDIEIPYGMLAEVVAAIVRPDYRKSYRLERIDDVITITVKFTEEGSGITGNLGQHPNPVSVIRKNEESNHES